MKRLLRCLFLIPLMFRLAAFPQGPEKTKIQYSGDSWQFNKDLYKDGPRLLGNVVMNHDSAYLHCDSAYVNEAGNRMTAYSKVWIRLSDTLNLYSDSLKYDGDTRIARAYGNVRLIDNQTVLTTDSLVYDRNTRVAQYDCWGKIVNDKNVLVSHYGYYYTDRKEFFFKEKVLLVNPDDNMYSDTLMYNTVSETAFFFGPSRIISKDRHDSILCENGWYNTRLDNARFRERARIYHEKSFLTGDSIYYERRTGYGQVFHKARIIDTEKNIVLLGNYGEMHRKDGFAFMTDSAQMVLADKNDSLFLHSDTVHATFDTLRNIKTVYCFYKVKFFRNNLQGMCDSLTYMSRDSSITMYHEPVVWSDSNQLTADSIRLTLRNGQADSLKMFNSAFIISKDDSNSFNQLKGRNVIGKFLNNELYKVMIIGNSQTIYYVREDDRSLIGINVGVSSDMLIYLEKNKFRSITYKQKPDEHLFPEKTIPPDQRKLKDFKWLEKQRPLKKSDIFTW